MGGFLVFFSCKLFIRYVLLYIVKYLVKNWFNIC
jgi:hypothetical protein